MTDAIDERLEIGMTKAPQNHGRQWKSADDRELQQLARANTPTRIIGLKLGRTPGAIYTHAAEVGAA
jgi:hypothetical protein